MSLLDDAMRATVRDAVRDALREELPAALAKSRPANGDGAAEYLSLAGAGKVANVHPDTVRRWLKAGALPSHHAGRQLRVRRDDLVRFLATGPGKGEQTGEQIADAILAKRRIGS